MTLKQPPKQPTHRLLDPGFKYTNAVSTDLRKTFQRIRRELAKQRQAA